MDKGFPLSMEESGAKPRIKNTYATSERKTHTHKKNARAILCARCARDLFSSRKQKV